MTETTSRTRFTTGTEWRGIWKFWVYNNATANGPGPWNTTGGYWTPAPGLGYGTISDVQRHFCLPVRALLNGDPVQPRSGYHTTAYDFRTA